MTLQEIYKPIWYLSPVLQTLLFVVLTSKRLYREYPFFYVYTASHIVRTFLAFNLAGSDRIYYQFYWGTEAYFAFLLLAVVQEFYRGAFADLPRLRRWHLVLFHTATALLLICCVVSAYVAPAIGVSSRLVAALLVLQRSLNLVIGGLSFVLLAVFWALGLSLQRRSAGIALGFAINSSIAFAAAASSGEDPFGIGIYAISLASAYALTLAIWNVSMLRPLPEPHALVSAAEVDSVRKWKRILEGAGS